MSNPQREFQIELVGSDGKVAVDSSTVHNAKPEDTSPSRNPTAYALIRIVSITGNQVAISIIDIEIKIIIAITDNNNLGKFAKIDIREWREIYFTAKRPRILTNMPSVK